MGEQQPFVFFLDTSNEYRERKEAFVTGHDGCSMSEVVAGLAPVTTGLLLNRVALGYMSLAGISVGSIPLPVRFLFEFCVIVMPSLLSFTLLADFSVHVALFQLGVVAMLHLMATVWYRTPLLSLTLRPDHALHVLAGEHRKSFVSNFRSCMMIATWIAILAVDFGVFPRRFAKTEMFGTSVMDMGVGAFIFSSAIVSRQTRRLRQDQGVSRINVLSASSGLEQEDESTPIERGRRPIGGRRRRTSAGTSAKSSSRSVSRQTTSYVAATNKGLASVVSPVYLSACEDMTKSLFSTLVAVSPLIVLGFGRLIVHSALNYQTHVTEYGVHWNFPFTAVSVAILAAVLELGWRVLLMLCQCCVHAEFQLARIWTAAWYGTLGFLVAIVYQQLLRSPITFPTSSMPPSTANATVQTTVQDYILYADRDHGFVAQNREGLASVCGFFAVYLCGVALGRVVLDTQRNSAMLWRSFAVKIGIICIGLWVVVETASTAYGPVSRRLVNFPYVAWIVAFTSSMLLSLLTIDLITTIPTMPEVPPEVCCKAVLPSTFWERAKWLFVRREPFAPACVAGGSIIMEATNVNFLALFIISNLLVGLVNHTMRTIDFDDASATAILSIYMLANCAIAVALKQIGIHLKFW